jgi:hypothetical protein
MNSVGNPENYRIFSANLKTDGMKVQPYFDRFPWHHILFSYRLPYLPNNMKMTKKIYKTEPVFPKILPTRFHLTCSCPTSSTWAITCNLVRGNQLVERLDQFITYTSSGKEPRPKFLYRIVVLPVLLYCPVPDDHRSVLYIIKMRVESVYINWRKSIKKEKI